MAIVTCGGLCPGLNDVVQGLVRKLEDYGVPDGNILGIKCAPCWAVARLKAALVRVMQGLVRMLEDYGVPDILGIKRAPCWAVCQS